MTKVMTVAGIAPEIIGMPEVIKRLDATADRVLALTGQNYDLRHIRLPHRGGQVDAANLAARLLRALPGPMIRRHQYRQPEFRNNCLETVQQCRPMGLHDYNSLQQGARYVSSDSGTIAEEATVTRFPGITFRDTIERPEALDAGTPPLTGLNPANDLVGIRYATSPLATRGPNDPFEYWVQNCSVRAVSYLPSPYRATTFGQGYILATRERNAARDVPDVHPASRDGSSPRSTNRALRRTRPRPDTPNAQARESETRGRASRRVVPMLFIGGLFDDRQRALVELVSRGPTQAAADALQWGFVEGLESIHEISLTILSAPFVGSYPRLFGHPTVAARPFEHGEPERNRQVGFLNLPVLKHFSRAVAISHNARKWALQQTQGGVALGYSLSLDIVWSLAEARRVNPNLVAAVIVPDLPEFMNTQERPRLGYRILKAVESQLARRLLSRLDGMILLTEPMADRLPSKPYLVLEGIARRSAPPSLPDTRMTSREVIDLSRKRIILYAGITNTRYGVVELCRAFRKVPGPELALVICGAGDGAGEVASQAEKDPRIHYLGQLPRATVLALESAATLLVNPRSNKEAFSDYSFPSKILEYMSTGVPVLCYKLGGIPTEYDSYLNYISGDTVDEFAIALRSTLRLPPTTLRAKGEAARRFVEAEKNPTMQARKVVDFLLSHGRERPRGRASIGDTD